VNITCDPEEFGPDGTEKGAELTFKITGLTNPRFKNYMSYFKLYTMDADKRYIDENKKNTQFWVKMTELKSITNVEIDVENQTNGAITTYLITITPSTQVHSFDVFTIDFPEQLMLPFGMHCGSRSQLLGGATCIKIGDRRVEITLLDVSKELTSGKAFTVEVVGVKNAPSLRPTSAFENMMFSGRHGNLIYQLTAFRPSKALVVKNLWLGTLDVETGTSGL